MTVNDYLARRDAKWMGAIYEYLGLSVGCIQQTMSADERRRAYACDITYATANEIGFDFLRDQLALRLEDQVHRPFHAAVIDEADSILIDESRIPLVLPGAKRMRKPWRGVRTRWCAASAAASISRWTNTAATLRSPTRASARPNTLFHWQSLRGSESGAYTAVHNAIHAHALLRRDVDYVVKDRAIESVDQFKGRIAPDRRWPAGLHTALEAKEGLPFRKQGRVLGSITLQNLVALYPQACGMTGTAATQADRVPALLRHGRRRHSDQPPGHPR